MEACKCIADGIVRVDDTAAILKFPMADGGDGFAEVLQHYMQTQTVACVAVDPLLRSIDTAYQWDEAKKTAIIELASASGLQLLLPKERNPLHTSTFGTGLLIRHAVNKGAENIILGLGGSATNDAGTGILSALGFIFLNGNEKILLPVGENLQHIRKIISPAAIPKIHFKIAVDVQNILYGKEGAAMVYAAQKGADERAVQILDKGLQQFATVVKSQTRKEVSAIPGSGAAGGIAAGLMAYLDIEIIQGAALVIEAGRMKEQMQGADLVITGEGKLDSQSSNGKVVQQVAAAGMQLNIPVIALCGAVEAGERQIKEMGFLFVKSMVNETITEMAAMQNAKRLLKGMATNGLTEFLNLIR